MLIQAFHTKGLEGVKKEVAAHVLHWIMQSEQGKGLVRAYCSICGKVTTPETGMSVAKRWIVCNEHAPLIRDVVITSGRAVVLGLDRYVKTKAPQLHNFINVAIKIALQQRG